MEAFGTPVSASAITHKGPGPWGVGVKGPLATARRRAGRVPRTAGRSGQCRRNGGGAGTRGQGPDCGAGYCGRGDKAMSANSDELRAKQWLESQGYTDILDLSRDSLDPPDFLVKKRIGVEVRRLNWMTDINRQNQGAEELERPLEKMIEKILKDAEDPPGGYIASVSCDLLRDTLPQASRIATTSSMSSICSLSMQVRLKTILER